MQYVRHRNERLNCCANLPHIVSTHAACTIKCKQKGTNLLGLAHSFEGERQIEVSFGGQNVQRATIETGINFGNSLLKVNILSKSVPFDSINQKSGAISCLVVKLLS